MARPERVGTTQSTVSYHGLRDWLDRVEKLGELQKVVPGAALASLAPDRSARREPVREIDRLEARRVG